LTACGTASPSGQSTTAVPVTVDAGVVPVGGAAIIEFVVVSQPTEGNFKAFSAICTHQQCLVSRVQVDQIICTCHYSVYSAADGSVVSGPAPRGLYERTVTRSGETLTVT
jgi:Rieske Fe-S protein